MLALLETLFEIIRLRKGPDAIPYSWALCLFTLMLWVVAGFAITLTTPEMDDADFLVATLTSVAGLACYASIIVLSGNTPRLLQTVTAIFGCGAVLSLVSVAVDVSLSPLLSGDATNIIVTLVLLWSVPVEGHIIARAIDRHWYVGIFMAMAVFIFQLYLFTLLNPDPAT
jgi:hypothetical protein